MINFSNRKQKSTKEIIQEIHHSFYTEVDNLLAEANILNNIETKKESLIQKCERLKELGFTNTKEVKEAELEIEKINSLKKENQLKTELTEAINYFSFKYPSYKFITEESVIKICQKYNLVYGSVENYIGTVPDANLKHIENFKIDPKDECFSIKTTYRLGLYEIRTINKYFSKESLEKEKEQRQRLYQMGIANLNPYYTESFQKCPLEIAAPVKDFDTKGMELKNFKLSKIEIPDPVVLKPVFFKGMKHYLIVTAWGDEASDELVLNANHN
jgi:hypothetical protein